MRVILLALCVALAYTLPIEPETVSIPAGSCGVNKYGNKQAYVVGGENAKENEFPHQVSLQRTSHTCGGSIIDKRWIISAAHCFSNSNPSSWKVITGMHQLYNTDATQETVYVEKIIKHPQYSSWQSNKNDIALMKLKKDLEFNDAVQPICLPGDSYPTDGYDLETTGWGTTSSGGSLARILQKVTVPAVTNEECAKAYPREKIYESTICAGDLKNGGIDACQGDSGGPLTHYNTNGSMVLVGITSWGYGCASKGYPGVYVRPSSYHSWIWKTIADNS